MEKSFENYKDKIIEAIEDSLKKQWQEDEKIYLVDWVWMLPVNVEISERTAFWKSLPMVAVIGTETWRIYFYSLTHLLPDIFN